MGSTPRTWRPSRSFSIRRTASTRDAAAIRSELVFVDSGVEDHQALLADLQSADSNTRELEVVLLDSERDGIQQISEILEGREDLDAVHIVSHGTEGAVQLGSTWLSGENLGAYESAIAGWGDALSQKADLLFYGCDLAGGASGAAFVESLSGLTGADVAASTDATGSAILGGDWDLELHEGVIETPVPGSLVLAESWSGLLDAHSREPRARRELERRAGCDRPGHGRCECGGPRGRRFDCDHAHG